MGSIVHRSVPTNLKWFPTCSHAHAMFQDRFKDVQVGSRWFSTLYILSPNFHTIIKFLINAWSTEDHLSPNRKPSSIIYYPTKRQTCTIPDWHFFPPETTFSAIFPGFHNVLSGVAPCPTGAKAPYGRSVCELEVPV